MSPKTITLTKADRLILDSYKYTLDGIAQMLGPACEIVLHSLENYEHSAVKIINGHYSGRSVGAPITDLALKMLAEIKKSGKIHNGIVYTHKSKRGTPIKSATIPITGERDQIIGLICINFYMDIPLYSYFESMLSVNSAEPENLETYAGSADELLITAIENARTEVMNNPNISSSNKNKEIISLLNSKGIFNLKDSVATVSKMLGLSRNTVYLHLRNLS